MVLPSKSCDPRLDVKTEKSHSSSKKGFGYISQTRKPLKNKKIYLDVKNHSVSAKLEGSLKSLGATIEVFLVRDVNLVVTDRLNWCSGSPLPSPSLQTPTGTCSKSPATTDSPAGGEQAQRCARSRAEAMLEKALLQPKQISLDPLDNALLWGISIWSLEKVLKWLEKVNSTDKSQSQDKRLLEKPFIKLETSHRHCPSYKEFSAWPTITLDFDAGGCPFSIPKHSSGKNVTQPNKESERSYIALKETDGLCESSRMTRKARSKLHQDVCSVRLPGYCEICQVKYSDQKTHVQSESHLQFVSDDRNFVSLDLLIRQRSSMDAFLKLNGASELTQCSMLGSPRRSLRSVLKLTSLDRQALSQDYALSNGQHATRASTLNMRQTLDEKNLLKVAQHEPLQILCNGMVNHNYETRHGSKVPAPIRRSFWDERAKPRRARTTSATFCNFTEEESLQLSPTGSDLGHHLRSRGHVSVSKHFPAEDERVLRHNDVHPLPPVCAKDQPKQLNCIVKDFKSKEPLKPCRGNTEVIRKKRPSAEEKLIEDNKAYYKLELKNSKLRSSRYYIPHKVYEANNSKTEACDATIVSFLNTNGEKAEDCESVKVMEQTSVKVAKNKKKPRRTELSVLSDEAESFMFGEPSRHDSSYESTEEELDESLVHACPQDANRNASKTRKDLECGIGKPDGESNSCLTPLQCDESSLGSVASSCDTGSTRRKRRTHAEAFIHDNLDYYKFEIPGSRLRHQGSNSPQASACKNVKESKVVNTNEVSVQVSLSPSGADLGQEEQTDIVACASSVEAGKDGNRDVAESGEKQGSYGSALQGLQYSFELVPESEPWYQTYKRQDEGEEVYFPQCETVRWKTFLLPYEIPSSDFHSVVAEPSTLGECGGSKYKKKRRNKYAHLLDSKPRKSPRCHASTLAILSSLRHSRKRREAERLDTRAECSFLDESSQDISVEAVLSKSEACELELAEPFQEIEKNFNDLLSTDKEDGLSIDVQIQDCELTMSNVGGNNSVKFPAAERRRSHSCRRKSTHSLRKLNGASSNNKEPSEIGPIILEELVQSCKEYSAVCLPKPKSGLDSDVLEILDSASTFCCLEKDSLSCRDCAAPRCEGVPSLSEMSCNSSECSVASTCDSSHCSDAQGKNSKSRLKKRKKKKNLTGWPIERHRKKGMKKTAEDDECKCNETHCNENFSRPENDGFCNSITPISDTVYNVEKTACNFETITTDVGSNVDNVERTVSYVARTPGVVESSERAEIDNVHISNCVGGNSLVPNVAIACVEEVADCVSSAEDNRQNGLSETKLEASAFGEVATRTGGSCRDDGSSNDIVELPVVKDARNPEGGVSPECGRDSFLPVSLPKSAKHGLVRTVSLEASRQSCEYQPCVRVLKITNLADMLSYSQGTGVASSRRLRSASSPSSISSPRRSQDGGDVLARRASPRKRVAKDSQWDVLVGKRR